MKTRFFEIGLTLFLLLFSSLGWAQEKTPTHKISRTLDRLRQPIALYGEEVTLQLSGEFRYRFELRDDFNLNNNLYEDDAVNLFRTRLNADLKIGPDARFFVQIQDAESVARSRIDESNAFVNQWDIHQLYGEIKSPWEKAPVHVIVGRQELSYGDERLVGAFNWSNVARVFDAVKIYWTPREWFRLDGWASQVVPVQRVQPDSADHSDHFYGLYAAYKPIKDHVLDSFLLVRHNTNNELTGEVAGHFGQLKEYTFGNRLKGKIKNLDYGLEWAAQVGSRADEKIQAWAWHNEVGYTLSSFPWTPRPNFEFNHGSGDNNRSDGKYKNFDNLYPTNHFYYGYMDFFSLKNMNDFKLGCDFAPLAKVKITTDYHWFFLDTNKSNWFKADQTTLRSTAPGASTEVGQEIDLMMTYKFNSFWNFMLGYSHFQAGPFVKNTGSADNANFFYTQLVWKL